MVDHILRDPVTLVTSEESPLACYIYSESVTEHITLRKLYEDFTSLALTSVFSLRSPCSIYPSHLLRPLLVCDYPSDFA